MLEDHALPFMCLDHHTEDTVFIIVEEDWRIEMEDDGGYELGGEGQDGARKAWPRAAIAATSAGWALAHRTWLG